MEKLTKADLDKVASGPKAEDGPCIKVGMSSCGIAAGAQEVFDLFKSEVEKRNIQISVKPCGCNGACYLEPLVEIAVSGLPVVTYGQVTPQVAMQILDEHVRDKRMVQDHIVDIPMRRQAIL
jgi:(2Fe-2S) ferredoxin